MGVKASKPKEVKLVCCAGLKPSEAKVAVCAALLVAVIPNYRLHCTRTTPDVALIVTAIEKALAVFVVGVVVGVQVPMLILIVAMA
jgi:hypothetical protein